MPRPVEYDDVSVVLPNEATNTIGFVGYHYELSQQQFGMVCAGNFLTLALILLALLAIWKKKPIYAQMLIGLGIVTGVSAILSLISIYLGLTPIYAC
ncbi:MAG: hypothetical protein ABIP54_00540 [Candidatus Andersenbacteria bacterium]